MEVILNDKSIVFKLNERKTLDEMLCILEGKRIDELEFDQELSTKYPKDYKFIMIDEEYGNFFVEGSPQIEECGWVFTMSTSSNSTELTITGIK